MGKEQGQEIEVVDCGLDDWKQCMRNHVKNRHEVHLLNFDYVDEYFCSDYADIHRMTFEYDKDRKIGIFRPVGA
jgi:hypothetical protein